MEKKPKKNVPRTQQEEQQPRRRRSSFFFFLFCLKTNKKWLSKIKKVSKKNVVNDERRKTEL